MNHEVIVIGGGQAGLAIGRHLAGQGREFTILEAADGPAAAWRARWDSLTLFTPARYDSLPGKQFPGEPARYPTRDEVVAYLTDYAADLPVEYGQRVSALRQVPGGYEVETPDATRFAEQVVVATGPFQVPRVPGMASALDARVQQLHSSDYRNPTQISGRRVLIVGGGNTGYQIAEELSRTHEVHLAVGSRQKPLPQRLLGRDLFDVFGAFGVMGKTADSRIGRRLRSRDTLIGSSPRKARRLGVQLRARAVAITGGDVRFADGTTFTPDVVIWATGFGTDHSWIEAPVVDAAGAIVHERGITGSPGLYFLGLPWLHTRGSALLGFVKHDAAYLAARIAAHQTSNHPALAA